MLALLRQGVHGRLASYEDANDAERLRFDPARRRVAGGRAKHLTSRSRQVVPFHNQRGTAEQWIKEGKNAVKWTRLSCRNFKDNHARLQLFAPAFNLGNFLRRLALPRSVKHGSLTTLREKLIRMGAKVVRHAKCVTFQLAEVAMPRELFAAFLDRIQRFGVPPPLVQRG